MIKVINKVCIITLTLVLICSGYSLFNTKPDQSSKSNPTYSLRQEAEKHNLLIGAAIEPAYLDEADYKNTLIREVNCITPENQMKWGLIHPKQNTYDYSGADKIVNFALENNMKVRGHNLVWHIENPKWLVSKKDWTKDELLNVLKDHITNVVGHYKGRIYAWDVLNEVLADGKGAYRDSLWYTVCGPEYIEKAFIWAHEADPNAKLFINDFFIEETGEKSDFLYNLVKNLRQKGIPIDGVGFQCHLDMDNMINMKLFYNNIKRFADLGVEIHFTELDIRITGELTPDKLKKQASLYGDILEILMSFKNGKALTMWGLTDKYSWIDMAYKDQGGALEFDNKYNPKPAYYALLNLLKKKPGTIDYQAKMDAIEKSRNVIPAFQSMPTDKAPIIDGVIDKDEWKDAVIYKFGYNQLNKFDQRLPVDKNDLYGEWRVCYHGNKLYGYIYRQDNITVTDNPDEYNNDCLELYLDTKDGFSQLRTLVGQDFSVNPMTGYRKAVWSKDGKICEFEVELPYTDLAGEKIGWTIALNDNDGGPVRSYQIYPVPGTNNCWRGIELSELNFASGIPKPQTKTHMIPPFIAMKASVLPVADGIEKNMEYTGGCRYQFAYNVLNAKDQRPPSDNQDLYGEWEMVYNQNRIYGVVTRTDDKTITNQKDPRLNDGVEVGIKFNNKIYQLVTVVGKDFESNELGDRAKAVWSKDGKTLEFTIDLGNNDLSDAMIGMYLYINDNDGGDSLKYKLSPIPGNYNPNDVIMSDLKFNTM